LLQPTKIDFTGDALNEVKGYLHERIEALTAGSKNLFQTKLPEWRRLYEARPLERNRQFPFENASNLVVPIIGIHCDTLHARIMASLWKTKPLFYSKLFGMYDKDMDPVRQAWEDFLVFEASEPEELNLYETESEWIAEIVRYGTSTLKIPNTQRYEDYFQPAGNGASVKDGNFFRKTVYDGPCPQKLAYQDFLIPENISRWQHADIKIHIARLTHGDLMQRKMFGVYDEKAVEAIESQPDRTSPDYVVKQRQEDADARTSSQGYREWDVHECWFSWRTTNGDYTPKVILWYHFKSNTLMRAVYDFYPDQPFVMGRLLYRDDSVRGYGLCETLGGFQEELSVIHNQRRDNQTVANTKVWRVDPNSKLHEGYKVYPGAMLPADEGEIEALQQGEVSQLSIEEENLSLDLAERRSGVSPPMQGMGAGSAQGKRGIYSAAGTLSLLQEGNRRTDSTIADIRYAHARLGQILSRQYAFLGLDAKKLKFFGTQEELIREAASSVKSGKLGISITASSASVNKEIEKQNDLMLTQIINKHYQSIGQLIQSIQSVQSSPAIKDYFQHVIDASNKLMRGILRNFDRDDSEILIPEVNLDAGKTGGAQNGNGPTLVPPIQNPAAIGVGGGGGSAGMAQGLAGFGLPEGSKGA
jgi:hypothetical protein